MTVQLTDYIRDVPDFPKPGILFKDITPLLNHAPAFQAVVDQMTEWAASKKVTRVCGIESRGFLFGTSVALNLGVGFVPIRKKGKLPYTTVGQEYALEYGTDHVEMHDDAITSDDRVLIVDDLIATGGTAGATVELIQKQQAQIVGMSFLIELEFLKGRDKLKGCDVQALIRY